MEEKTKDLYLVFISRVGKNVKSEHIYDFMFSETKDLIGNGFDEQPCSIATLEPSMDDIKKIRRLETKINFKLGSENSSYCYFDVQDGILSICFEPLDGEDETVYSDQRIILFYGDTEREIVTKLNERNINFGL